MRRTGHFPFIFPLMLMLIAVLSFGLLIPKLGFYGDDWSYVWYHQIMGFKGPGLFAAFDRPFSAPFYNITITLLGSSPWPYHVFLLFLRWLSGYLLWGVLNRLWLKREKTNFWIAALFIIYPCFSQGPVSVEYILHFSTLDLYLLSVLLMLASVKATRWRWLSLAASVVFSANIFAIEYFVGLELLRPVLLLIVYAREGSPVRLRLRKTLLVYLPFMLVLVSFLVWRIFIFKFPTYTPGLLDQIKQSPSDALIYLVKRILLDLKTVLYYGWKQTIQFPDRFQNRIIYAVAVTVSFFAVLLVSSRFDTLKENENSAEGFHWRKQWALQPILLGILALLLAGWPFWITGILLELSFPWDRPTLPFMLGASLLFVGLLDLLIRHFYRAWFVALLISLAVGFHIANAEVYQVEWENLKDFIWQLSWRVPGLEKGAVLASDDIPLFRVSDSALTAPLSWTYAPGHHSANLPFKLFDLSLRMGTEYAKISAVERGLPIEHDYRSTHFSSTTSSLLVFYYPQRGCLRILSPEDNQLPFLPEKVISLLTLSNLAMIKTEVDPAQPPDFLGPEPEHGWCYYFQKADLAHQSQAWQQVIAWGEKAFDADLQPSNKSELLPFIEAYAHEGSLDRAEKFTKEVLTEERLIPALCTTWDRITQNVDFTQDELNIVNRILEQSSCMR